MKTFFAIFFIAVIFTIACSTQKSNQLGFLLSACYMQNHNTMLMWGVDVKLTKTSPISIVYSQSSDNQLNTIGLKFPIFNNHTKGH